MRGVIIQGGGRQVFRSDADHVRGRHDGVIIAVIYRFRRRFQYPVFIFGDICLADFKTVIFRFSDIGEKLEGGAVDLLAESFVIRITDPAVRAAIAGRPIQSPLGGGAVSYEARFFLEKDEEEFWIDGRYLPAF